MTFLAICAGVLALSGAFFAWIAACHWLDSQQEVRSHPARERIAGSGVSQPLRRSPRPHTFARYHRQLRRQMRRAERDLDRYLRGNHLP